MEQKYKNLKEITPRVMMCGDDCCPAIFETGDGKCLIVGKRVNPDKAGLGRRVGKDEALIEVDKGLLK